MLTFFKTVLPFCFLQGCQNDCATGCMEAATKHAIESFKVCHLLKQECLWQFSALRKTLLLRCTQMESDCSAVDMCKHCSLGGGDVKAASSGAIKLQGFLGVKKTAPIPSSES